MQWGAFQFNLLGLSVHRQLAGRTGHLDRDAVCEQERESRDLHADLYRGTCRRQPHSQYDRATYGAIEPGSFDTKPRADP